VTLSLTATGPFTVNSPSGELVGRSAGKSHVARLTIDANTDELIPVTITLQTSGNPGLSVTWNTAEDERPRPLALHRMLVPWALRNPKDDTVTERKIPELEGGSWARGRKVFFGEPAGCAKCHTIQGQGGGIGPDLSNLVHRAYHSVLRAIAAPSHA